MFRATDAFGAISDSIITISQATQMLLDSVVQGTITVYGGTTNVTIYNHGGTPVGDTVYRYAIDGGSYTLSTTNFRYTFSSVSGGNHTVSIKDTNNCIVTFAFFVAQPAAPVQSIKKNQGRRHIYRAG